MTTPRRAGLLLFSLLLLNLAGCASWFDSSETRDPQIHLLKIETVKARLMEQQFILHMRIDNPNDSSLVVRSLHYAVRLNDLLLTEGDADLWFTVEGKGRETFEVPVRTNLWQHLKPIVKMLKNTDQPIHYQLTAELGTGLFFTRDLHLLHKGEIIPGDLFPE
ncbi:LEA type 2 family protein [Pseudomonas fontis]|uniref:LEA type 2 family protein n=1 Tax=Pseudomonas fontis TaxID=2942633 RepID=A0ABT5NWK9_9PSED|nr:LEA type 2 family protein [Pseudomonas fontis]MDD0973461.1 LEA type 2 family protein [Pseudomonas fontis]MDD0992558.1 LEA type 2 family protein [Pseudomonas fontis]